MLETVGKYEDEGGDDFRLAPAVVVAAVVDVILLDVPENREPVIEGVFGSSQSRKEELVVGITLNSRSLCNRDPERRPPPFVISSRSVVLVLPIEFLP